MNKKPGLIAIIAGLMAVVMLLSGCLGGGNSSTGNNGGNNGGISSNNGGNSGQTDVKKPFNISGTDIFGGQRFNEMLWSYYEEESFESTGSRADSEEFRSGMKYITVKVGASEYEISGLPLSVQFGQYSHFIGTFSYEGEYYEPFTETGRAMFRKAYMAEKGDLTEEDFQKIEQVLQLDVAQMTFTDSEGMTRIYTFAYEVKDNQVYFYTQEIDDDYNILLSEQPVIECDFLHDGGKLILDYKGVQRTYLTSGYKPTDKSMTFSGYALNENNQLGDLEGFSLYQYGYDEEITAYVCLANDQSPVDPVFTLDKATGAFTLSWTQRWVEDSSGTKKLDDPTSISGTIIPCTSYGFTDYSGFFMIVDGTYYRYLMSEQEYEERKAAAYANAAALSQKQLEDLAAKKRDLLAELVAAFKAKGIEASVDYNTGKVSLASNFLFESGSYELSQAGRDYVNAFMSVYTSVVMSDDYAGYISEVVVEGHTDTNGSYSYNQTLSQNRAQSVLQQCTTHTPAMANILRAVGYSYDYPVYNDNGSINMEKSRRVTFSFVLTAK